MVYNSMSKTCCVLRVLALRTGDVNSSVHEQAPEGHETKRPIACNAIEPDSNNFRPIFNFISGMIQDGAIVTMEYA